MLASEVDRMKREYDPRTSVLAPKPSRMKITLEIIVRSDVTHGELIALRDDVRDAAVDHDSGCVLSARWLPDGIDHNPTSDSTRKINTAQ